MKGNVDNVYLDQQADVYVFGADRGLARMLRVEVVPMNMEIKRHDIVIGLQSVSRAGKGKTTKLETLSCQMEKLSMEEKIGRLYNRNDKWNEDWIAYDLRHQQG